VGLISGRGTVLIILGKEVGRYLYGTCGGIAFTKGSVDIDSTM
jgi:hypothetical protein